MQWWKLVRCWVNLQPGSDEGRKWLTLPGLWSKRLGEASGSLPSQTLRTGWRPERRGWILSICDRRWRDTALVWGKTSDMSCETLQDLSVPWNCVVLRPGSDLLAAVSSSDARASASHVFAPCTLKNAAQPGGGGSLDAIWEKKKKDVGVAHGWKKKKKSHNERSGRWYLLEGVHRGRVGSKGEGELEHVHLDGAEQSAGSLDDQLIVGLICVCATTARRGRVSFLRLYHSFHLFIYSPYGLFVFLTLPPCVLRSVLKCIRGSGELGRVAVGSSISTCFCWLRPLARKHWRCECCSISSGSHHKLSRGQRKGKKWKYRCIMTEAFYNTIMLSFNVLIGLHKVPELFLALFCQEFTEREGRCNVTLEQSVSLTGNFQVHIN